MLPLIFEGRYKGRSRGRCATAEVMAAFIDAQLVSLIWVRADEVGYRFKTQIQVRL